jgi:hypothetical protein
MLAMPALAGRLDRACPKSMNASPANQFIASGGLSPGRSADGFARRGESPCDPGIAIPL